MSVLLNSIPENVRRSLRVDALAGMRVLSARGADALSFLHSQLTQDVQGLADDARLAGYCTAKGRLLATLVMWRSDDAGQEPGVRMLVRADLAQALLKRLSMFVLRAKVKLAIVPAAVSGLSLDAGQREEFGQWLGTALSGEAWQCLRTPHGVWITAPGADPSRLRGWLIEEAAPETEASAEDDTPAAQSGDAAWTADDIAAGLPWIGAATQDLFIPQTLNLELIGGVSFTKGCYPGQEVVARSHYRGTVKRRMAGGTVIPASPDAAPGADVYQADRPDSPCGRIIDAATTDGVAHVLFEAPFDAVDAGNLHVGAADGPALAVAALPYDTRV